MHDGHLRCGGCAIAGCSTFEELSRFRSCGHGRSDWRQVGLLRLLLVHVVGVAGRGIALLARNREFAWKMQI